MINKMIYELTNWCVDFCCKATPKIQERELVLKILILIDHHQIYGHLLAVASSVIHVVILVLLQH